MSETTPRPLLVVGAGIAGVTAAIEAAEAGRDVVLLEKEARRLKLETEPDVARLLAEATGAELLGRPAPEGAQQDAGAGQNVTGELLLQLLNLVLGAQQGDPAAGGDEEGLEGAPAAGCAAGLVGHQQKRDDAGCFPEDEQGDEIAGEHGAQRDQQQRGRPPASHLRAVDRQGQPGADRAAGQHEQPAEW